MRAFGRTDVFRRLGNHKWKTSFSPRSDFLSIDLYHRRHSLRLFSSKGNNIDTVDQNEAKETWKVPDYIPIPEDRIDFSFVRSSGAGGQNVNKVNSQVQLRFHVPTAFWIPHEVRQRLVSQFNSRINKDDFLIIAAQEHRTQTANRKEALSKLQAFLKQAWERPKERKMRTGISKKTKEQRKEFKRRRSEVKERRRRVDLD